MTRERWRAVARVIKTHGRRGEVVSVPAHGLPSLLRRGMEVAIVPPGLRDSRRLVVRDVVSGRSGQLVSFEGVDGLDASTPLVGRSMLARVVDLPRGWELLDADLPIGFRVVDARLGELGSVRSAEHGGNGLVWSVEGERGVVLMPAVCEMVSAIDVSSRLVTCSLPVGLVPWDRG